MSAEAHIEQLREKHIQLEQAISVENQRPHPDDLVIADLKRQKLRVKDEIHRLEIDHH